MSNDQWIFAIVSHDVLSTVPAGTRVWTAEYDAEQFLKDLIEYGVPAGYFRLVRLQWEDAVRDVDTHDVSRLRLARNLPTHDSDSTA